MDIDDALSDPGLRAARMNAVDFDTDVKAITPMPPEFQLKHPRRLRWSGYFPQADGEMAHIMGSRNATPAQEAWHRINDPEDGLHPEDLAAYRHSQRGPVAGFFALLKFWR